MKVTVPKHLSKEAGTIFKNLCEEYGIDDEAGLRILKTALESYDRAAACRETIDRDGLTVVDKAGQTKAHPLLAIERDSRAAFLSGLKHLNLDLEPLKNGPGRPAGR